MIISHKYKYIFIKTAKTAGSSVEAYLNQFAGKQDIFTPLYPPIVGHKAQNTKGVFNPLPEIWFTRGKQFQKIWHDWVKKNKYKNHMTAISLKSRLSSKVWNNYYKFTIERNPWDKVVSLYHMFLYRNNSNLSFEAFVHTNKLSGCYNFPKYTDKRGHLLVDRVLSYERLTEELGEVFHRLKIPYDGELNIYAKSNYRSKHRPYKDYYNENAKMHVADFFFKEINLWGYEF